MILNFSLRNFYSIKEEQILSFIAEEKAQHLIDAYTHKIGKYHILKLILIFGANASGKTTILRGLHFLRTLCLTPLDNKNEKLNFLPFLFDAETPKQTSSLSINFIQNSIEYLYSVEFSKNAIVSEELYFYNPRKALVFSRQTNLEKQTAQIKIGSKISKNKDWENLEINTLWNNTVLGAYQKINTNIEILQEVSDWFKDYLKPMIHSETKLEAYTARKIEEGEILKEDILTILKRADFFISDILIEKEEKEIPKELLPILIEHLKEVEDIEKLKTFSSIKIDLEHKVEGKKYALPLKEESQGTQRYYSFAALLALLIKKSTAFPIDELEASLHPDLYKHFLTSFLVNKSQSQLIATTHNREILADKYLFRNDAIWFTDKGNCAATQLYSLADFDSSIIRDSTNILNSYKSGRLSAIPILGSSLIDFEFEKDKV